MIDTDDIEIRRHLRAFIAERLQAMQMSQADLARSTGDSQVQIGRVIKGENTPSVAFAARIARALEVSLDELCGITSPVSS
jgi:transcriptional regulator with XRE-family HTH domain